MEHGGSSSESTSTEPLLPEPPKLKTNLPSPEEVRIKKGNLTAKTH